MTCCGRRACCGSAGNPARWCAATRVAGRRIRAGPGTGRAGCGRCSPKPPPRGCQPPASSGNVKQAFGLVRRPWGVFYLKHKITGEQKSLKTSDKHEAQRILQAHNESECQPYFNLSLARVYLNGADPKLATRTWQEVRKTSLPRKRIKHADVGTRQSKIKTLTASATYAWRKQDRNISTVRWPMAKCPRMFICDGFIITP